MPLGMSKNAFFVNQAGGKLAFQQTNNNSFDALYVADNTNNQFSDTAILPSYQFMIYRIDETTREWEYFIRCEEDQFTQSAYDVMSRDGELYVCGAFSKIGTQSISRLAKYEGDFESWSSVGGTAPNNTVWNMDKTVTGSAAMYICGDFTSVGGVSANRIAKWDDTAWSSLGSGLNSTGRFVQVDSSGNVYVAGNFTTAGGSSTNRVAKWDGSSWSAMGSGLASNNTVLDMMIDQNDDLWIVGSFTSVSGVSANRVAKWDASGATWTTIGTGFNNTVTSITQDNSGNYYFTGPAVTAVDGNSITNRLIKWDGVTGWSNPGLPNDAVLWISSFNQPRVWWMNGNLYWFSDIINSGATKFYVYNDSSSTWSIVDGAPKGYGGNWGGQYEMDLHDGKAYLVSYRSRRCGTDTTGVLGGKQNGIVESISNKGLSIKANFWFDSDTNRLFLLGRVFGGQPYFPTDNLGRSNSKYWDPDTQEWVHFLVTNSNGVDIPVKIGSDYYFACGGNGSDNMLGQSLVKWNGTGIRTGFTTVGGNFTGAICVGTDGTNLYAGGSFTTAPGSVSANRVAKWNGTAWSALGTGMNGNVTTMVQDPNTNKVYMGGAFTTADGLTANRIVCWDGTGFSELSTGMNNTVTRMVYDSVRDNLYAIGTFTTAGGVSASRLAKWDATGATWSSVGGLSYTSFVSLTNIKMDETRGLLYLCGNFDAIVDDVVLMNMGIWSEEDQKWYPFVDGNMKTNDGHERSGSNYTINDFFPLPDDYTIS